MIKFGTPHRHLAQCGSTNDLARDWARDLNDPAPSGALVTAEFQTQGRGQRGRQWSAGFGQSALMSFVYHLPNGAEASQLGLVVALAVAEAIAEVTGVNPRIKWPNDVLLDGKKAAGILIEAAPGQETGGEAILGIGINVNQDRFVGAEEFVYPPTSLKIAAGREIEVQTVIASVSRSLSSWEERWRQEGFLSVLEKCRDRLAVGVTVRQGETRAELIGLAASGAAQVQLADGTFDEWTTVD